MRWKLDAWERALLVLTLAGLWLRVDHVGKDSIAADAAWYATMAESLLRHGEFLVPWAEGVQYTHHFPPLYPAFLALFFLPAGPSFAAIQLANVVAAVGFVAAAFLCTRDLYGRRPAFVAAAFAATLPTLLFFDHEGLSETFVAAIFTVTIWAILRSLDEPRYIVVAGVFAGLGYLAKASMGPFFVLAGAAGFLWRFAYVKWAVFRDRWYLFAAFLFACFVVPWVGRNLVRHGDWQTQRHASEALDALFATAHWPLLVAGAFGLVVLLLASQCTPFLPAAWRRLREWKLERTSGILLAVVMPLFVAAFFVAGFSITENFRLFSSPHPLRYAITPVIPLLWLGIRDLDWSGGLREGRPTSGHARIRASDALAVAGASIVALALALRYPYFYAQTAAEARALIAWSAVGLAVAAGARMFAWEASERRAADGSTSWRAVPAKPRLAAVGVAALVFALAWFGTPSMIAPVLAGALAAAVATWRQRAVVIAIVFLGWGLGGGIGAQAYDEVGAHIAEIAGPDDTLAASVGIEPMMWPFVPEHVRMLPWGANATYLVMVHAAPDPPAGYETVAGFGKQDSLGPVPWLRWRIELALRGEVPGEQAPSLHLYRKVA